MDWRPFQVQLWGRKKLNTRTVKSSFRDIRKNGATLFAIAIFVEFVSIASGWILEPRAIRPFPVACFLSFPGNVGFVVSQPVRPHLHHPTASLPPSSMGGFSNWKPSDQQQGETWRRYVPIWGWPKQIERREIRVTSGRNQMVGCERAAIRDFGQWNEWSFSRL